MKESSMKSLKLWPVPEAGAAHMLETAIFTVHMHHMD